MGKCIICGKSAGLLSNLHADCQTRRDRGRKSVRSLLQNFADSSSGSVKQLEHEIMCIAEADNISASELHRDLVSGWEESVRALCRGVTLTEVHVRCLDEIRDTFRLSITELDERNMYSRFTHLRALQVIRNGDIPEYQYSGVTSLQLNDAERLFWVFKNVELAQRRYRSVPQQVGALQQMLTTAIDRPARRSPLEHVTLDSGDLYVTDQRLVYRGAEIQQSVERSKIHSLTPASGGVTVQQISVDTLPLELRSRDSWFIYQLLVPSLSAAKQAS